jgi:hypothetical protein
VGRQNKNVHYLHGDNIKTFFTKYLQFFVFLQIKKPFVIRQPNIQVKKRRIFTPKKNKIAGEDTLISQGIILLVLYFVCLPTKIW